MRARNGRRIAVVLALVAGIAAMGFGAAPEVDAASRWAPAGSATIHPGVVLTSEAGQCTANFVFYDGPEVFLGSAAHCTGRGSNTDTNGCSTKSLPLGSPVRIQGASRLGTLVYSSWAAMQAAGETDPDVCAYNDFAVIRVDPADRGRVNPSIPHWGGPIGINRKGLASGSSVHGLGNSPLRGGSLLLQPKTGVAIEELGKGWSHMVLLVLPGIPGDSGSGLVDKRGVAVGVASTLGLLPVPASNNFADVGRTLGYAWSHGLPNLRLAVGTQPFNPNQLPLGI